MAEACHLPGPTGLPAGDVLHVLGQTGDVAVLLTALVLVHGVVMRGPTKPVCEMATPCSEPAAGLVLVFTRGAASFRARTGADGSYAIRLRRGTYLVHSAPTPKIGRGLEPATVVVRRPQRADFVVDTGIR